MTSWIPFWRTSTIAVELCEKVLFIMDDVVNDMNKDGVDILGGDGLQVKGYEGNNGDVLPKDAVTNELTWGKVNIPDNSIFSSMIVNGTIQFEDQKNLSVTTAKREQLTHQRARDKAAKDLASSASARTRSLRKSNRARKPRRRTLATRRKKRPQRRKKQVRSRKKTHRRNNGRRRTRSGASRLQGCKVSFRSLNELFIANIS